MFAGRSGIYLENLKREKSTIIKASVPVKEFKNVAKIAGLNKFLRIYYGKVKEVYKKI